MGSASLALSTVPGDASFFLRKLALKQVLDENAVNQDSTSFLQIGDIFFKPGLKEITVQSKEQVKKDYKTLLTGGATA